MAQKARSFTWVGSQYLLFKVSECCSLHVDIMTQWSATVRTQTAGRSSGRCTSAAAGWAVFPWWWGKTWWKRDRCLRRHCQVTWQTFDKMILFRSHIIQQQTVSCFQLPLAVQSGEVTVHFHEQRQCTASANCCGSHWRNGWGWGWWGARQAPLLFSRHLYMSTCQESPHGDNRLKMVPLGWSVRGDLMDWVSLVTWLTACHYTLIA